MTGRTALLIAAAGAALTVPGNAAAVDHVTLFVSPGFNDGHVHIDSTGALLTGVNLLDVHDKARFVERIKGATERLPK